MFGRERVKSPRCAISDADHRPVPLTDELGHIGYTEEVDPSTVFEKTGWYSNSHSSSVELLYFNFCAYK